MPGLPGMPGSAGAAGAPGYAAPPSQTGSAVWSPGDEGEVVQEQERFATEEEARAREEMEEEEKAESQMHDTWKKALMEVADAAMHAYQKPSPAAAPAAPAKEESTEAEREEQMKTAVTSAVKTLYKRLVAAQKGASKVRTTTSAPVAQPPIPARRDTHVYRVSTSVDNKLDAMASSLQHSLMTMQQALLRALGKGGDTTNQTAAPRASRSTSTWWKWMDSMARRRHWEQDKEQDEEVCTQNVKDAAQLSSSGL